MNKVLIGALVSKYHWYCTKEFLESLKLIDYDNFDIFLIENSDTDKFYNWLTEKIKDFDKGINNFGRKIKIFRYGNEIKTTQEKLAVCRNYLRDLFLKGDYDYFFSLDQDVIVPPKDVLKKMVSHDKGIITGVYHNYFILNEAESRTPVLYVKYTQGEIEKLKKMNKDELKNYSPDVHKALEGNNWDFSRIFRNLSEQEISGKGLIEIDMCGTGCIFISKNVLEKIPFRFNELTGFDDVAFCNEAKLNKLDIYADCTIICEHYAREKPWAWCNVGNEQMILYGAGMFKIKPSSN